MRQMTGISSSIPPATDNAGQDPIEELPVAYVEVKADGVITRSNRAARALHSADAHEIVGMHAWDFSPEGQSDFDRNAFFATMSAGVEPLQHLARADRSPPSSPVRRGMRLVPANAAANSLTRYPAIPRSGTNLLNSAREFSLHFHSDCSDFNPV